MDIGIKAVGGYEEVGKNMTAVRVGDEMVIFDMGLHLDRVQIHEETQTERMHSLDLIDIGAIPDDTILNSFNGDVVGIVCSHGHLDHVGAVSKLAHRYDAPIIATPFTAEIIKKEIRSEVKFNVDNPVYELEAGQHYLLSPDIELEFIRTQHSIPDCVLPVIHTPKGAVLYGLDFKLDRRPVLGEETDVKRLKELGNENVVAAIVDSTNVMDEGKTPSESIAREMVWDTLHEAENEDVGVFVTTFSSHIARIKSIVEAAEEMDRRPVLLGRSMERYTGTAEEMDIVSLPDNVGIYGSPQGRDQILRKIKKEGRENYLIICTGHQGEPGATLTRLADGTLPLKINERDHVVFSAKVIPNPLTRANRYSLETKLKMQGARLFKEVHVSGHGSKQDNYDLIDMIDPDHIIPAHGDLSMNSEYAELAESMGYCFSEDVHILRNGQELVLG
ncbi:RNase J family beta-CASP ribonuclease [Methanonatronarchaeum sp. AMET6-2]|uniref:RNase J family beta-CASP ribonuclease n=1 Tax=Methanonatronarchaeum sp. AMET6-2 TaxID=2933293 RepID=UPI00122A011C|nr:RNase J family beta-CASP ribonuclease [Methanonatronarchaeum sp. AMET6-2]RZN61893.1 MAG: RNase J family beta-CASP ribonuclease [Methanonatronarchaeia archaeon]UOY10623.1 RNase J family beta-CASP ribonuclease [Methanonatronarchaeum sp. AMET6-2]